MTETHLYPAIEHEVAPLAVPCEHADTLASPLAFFYFITQLPIGTHSVPGHKYIKVRIGKYTITIEVVTKSTPKNFKRTLLKHTKTKLSATDLELVLHKYKNFLKEYEDIKYSGQNINSAQTDTIYIRTMKQLLEFHLNTHEWESKKTRIKVARMTKRYAQGKEGNIDLRTATQDTLIKEFLDRAANSPAPTDRDELLKRIKAAYHYAALHPNVAKLEFPEPLSQVKRQRASELEKMRLKSQQKKSSGND